MQELQNICPKHSAAGHPGSQVRHLHVVSSIDISFGGGLGIATHALHRSMLGAGMDSRLIATGPKKTERAFTRIPLALPNPAFYTPWNRSMIRAAVSESDVVHTHGMHTHLNWCAGDYCKAWKKSLVIHPHGNLSPWYLRKRQWAKRVFYRLFERRNFEIAALWRAVAPSEEAEIRAFAPGARIATIPNGVDLCSFPVDSELRDKRHFTELDPTRRWLVFFGRVAPVKGIDFLLTAWSRLGMFSNRWQLVIVGPDYEGYSRWVQRQTVSFEGTHRPVLRPKVEGYEKTRLLSCADLFILPSRAEGFSMAILEAMAAKVPVLASTACNFPDITREQAGWICEPSADHVYATLRQALSEGQEALRQRGANGRALVERKYTWEKASEALSEAVNSL